MSVKKQSNNEWGVGWAGRPPSMCNLNARQLITQVLAKITSRTPAQIKQLLDATIERLIEPQQAPFYQTATQQNGQ
ncbi:hypothetical protein QUA56_08365 [Microcoleus sp. N3A4]|uniref:hypothetical protein n=1 Tax=Microcoleus sp. N3A4 TaxID=3055379 RepID=UPI002FD68D48